MSLKADLLKKKVAPDKHDLLSGKWPERHIHTEELKAVPFHRGQELSWDSGFRTTAMLAGTQGGKDLALDTLVVTPNGLVEIGDINTGDYVYAPDGTKTLVRYVSPVFTDHKCYLITFDDGSEVVAGEDHQWIVQDYKTRKNCSRNKNKNNVFYLQKTTSMLAENVVASNGGSNWSIEVSSPVSGVDSELPIHPYVLGVWLGDGHSNSPVITSADEEILNRIESIGYTVKNKGHGNCGKANEYVIGDNEPESGRGRINNVTRILRSLGVRNNKHIPDMYLNASISARKELLAGLLDTDGYCNDKGQAEFYNTNEQLFNDFVQLACSLGYKVRTRRKIAKCYGKECGYVYSAIFSSECSPFILGRKQKAHKTPIRQNTKRRYIKSIELVDTVPTKCIAVDHPSHMYLITRSHIATHNTSFGPHWLIREVYRRGAGDYLAVTASFDLFKLKMLPSMRLVFEDIFGVGRYWAGDKVIELKNPATGDFKANRATDPMWARIILRSADALGGLESSTAKAVWLDEAGQDRFSFDAYKAIRRRGTIHLARILMTTTLYNIGWLTQHVIDPAVADGQTSYEIFGDAEIELTDCPKTNTRIIQYDSILNPSFPKEEYEEAKSLLPDEEFQMFYRGRKSSRRFLIYDSFEYTKHTCPPFIIPDSWNRYMGVDFGGAHTCAMYYAEDPTSHKLYCYREYLSGGRSIAEHVNMMLANEPSVPSAFGGARSEDQWRNEFSQHGLPIMSPATDDIDLGINRVYAQHVKDGIIYFNNLSGILDEKGKYRRKRDKEGNIVSDIERKNTFHRLDSERYLVATIRPGDSMRIKVVALGE